jgi:hypothetical protein
MEQICCHYPLPKVCFSCLFIRASLEASTNSRATSMNTVNAILRCVDRFHSSARASDERVRHAIPWIDWGFYVVEWYIFRNKRHDETRADCFIRKFVLPLNRRKSIRKPSTPKLWEDDSSLLTQDTNPDYWWFAYPVSALPQRSYKREIFAAECALTVITEDVLDFLLPLEAGSLPVKDPNTATQLYARLVKWKYSLPECLEAQNAELPTAILLQYEIFPHLCVLHLT